MEKLKEYGLLVVVVVMLGLVGFLAVRPPTIIKVTDKQEVEVLGISQKASKFTDVEVTNELQTADLTVTDDVAITDDVSVGGDLALTGTLNGKEGYTDLNLTATVTTTLTAAMSGETFYFGGVSSTAFVLPATSTAAGTYYNFVVDSAMSTDCTIQTAGGANIIEGAMIVAGAVVDCATEDTITFVADGENLGDYVEVRSNGTNWFIGDSGALSSSKMTCTTST